MKDSLKLRELKLRTNAGLADCREALEESFWNLDFAIQYLINNGKAEAVQRRSSSFTEGRIHSYVHHDNKQGCIVEVNCQSAKASNTEEFKDFCEALVLQIISMKPKWLTSSEIPDDILDMQRASFNAQNYKDGYSKAEIVHRSNLLMRQWFSKVCLMDQKAIVSDSKTIEELRQELVLHLKENVIVKRFEHWVLGVGV